jgi:predicted TPR repeat methyltransferase
MKKTTTAKPYSQLARVYDLMGADRHSMQMTEYCRQIFRRFRIHPQTVLDLCCGTGSALQVFSDWGLSAAGLDQSAAMLAMAAKKLKGRKIGLYQKSLPRFALLDGGRSNRVRRFDLVTSFYDSLNYLTTVRDLKAAFRSVHRHLVPGGWFIFDMNTEAALKILWGGQVYAGAMDEIAWIWQNNYIQRRHAAECQTTCFVRKGKLWERFDEIHLERAYPNEQIAAMLAAVGFEEVELFKCHTFRRPTKSTYRICGVARKPGGK